MTRFRGGFRPGLEGFSFSAIGVLLATFDRVNELLHFVKPQLFGQLEPVQSSGTHLLGIIKTPIKRTPVNPGNQKNQPHSAKEKNKKDRRLHQAPGFGEKEKEKTPEFRGCPVSRHSGRLARGSRLACGTRLGLHHHPVALLPVRRGGQVAVLEPNGAERKAQPARVRVEGFLGPPKFLGAQELVGVLH